jgi:hypothetical protein
VRIALLQLRRDRRIGLRERPLLVRIGGFVYRAAQGRKLVGSVRIALLQLRRDRR